MSYLKRIHDAGFDHVRINFFAFKFMNDAGVVDEAVLRRLDHVIEQVAHNGLIPVLDEHDYGACQSRPLECAEKLKSFWKQISDRYAGKFPTLIFELLNEPGGGMTAAAWNALAGELLKTIREKNPDRLIIVAAINSEDLTRIEHPTLPENDRNLILTFHYYAPFAFTHQGAPWSADLTKLKDVKWGSRADRERMTEDFDRISEWSKRENRPIYLGEFGVLEYAPLPDRLRYIRRIVREAERRGWSWAYWQFDHDFAAFDTTSESWVRPVLNALIPRRSSISDHQR
jgi:endoglucanase